MKESQPIDDMLSLGRLIREARKDQGLTQQQLADGAGVGVRFLSELERGKETAEVGLVLQVIHSVGLELLVERRGARSAAFFFGPDRVGGDS